MDSPSSHQRTCVVTGANSGIGFATARELACHGHRVILVCRNAELGRRAQERIDEAAGTTRSALYVADLASQRAVRGLALELGRLGTIDALINNAGAIFSDRQLTEDGVEAHFATNYLSAFLLTRLLHAPLARVQGRVINLSSVLHKTSRIRLDDLHFSRRYYHLVLAYGQSKLANYHFALGLQQEFEKRGLAAQSLVAHPGLSHTNLQVHAHEQGGAGSSGGFWKWMAANTGMTADRGALPQLRAATDPTAKGGEMYAPRFVNNGPPVRRPILRPGRQKAIDILWDVSENLTGTSLDFDAATA